jgi:hypothetical protein
VTTATLIALLVTGAPEPQRWFPFSARGGFTAFISTSGSPTLGADLEVQANFGRPGSGPLPFSHQGFVFSAGLRGFFGGSPSTACSWCLARLTVGPLARLSYVGVDRLDGPGRSARWRRAATVPDEALWIQVSPQVVRESLPDAPLMPGGTRLAFAARVDLGITLFSWTRALLTLAGVIHDEGSVEVGAATLPLFLLAFINHLALSWEWTTTAFSMSGHRFGATIGFSF